MPVKLHPTFGSRIRFLPEPPTGSVAQSVEQKGSFTTDLSSRLSKNGYGECRMELQHDGMLREVRLLTCTALSGTSGTPGFIFSCRRGRRTKWRMPAGLQLARPPKSGRSGVQITLSRFESARRSVDRSVSRIDLSPAQRRKTNGECRQDYRIEHPSRKRRKVGCLIHPRPSLRVER